MNMEKPLRVLFVEDNPDDAELSLAELRRAGFAPEWERVDTKEAYLAALKKAPDIILSDYSMPEFSGLEAARILRKQDLDTPFILISGTVGEEAAVESMQLGATDYLLKDRLVRLGSAVERALREARDRQERKKAEEQVELQSRALEAAANAIMITDRHGSILSANAAFCRLTGYEREEVLGKNPRFLKSGAHDDAFYREMWATICSGKSWQGEIQNRRKDGTVYVEEMTITPVTEKDGTITNFIAVKQDTTERKRIDARFRRLVNSNAQGVMFWNRGGIITGANDAFLDLVGYTQEDMEAGLITWAGLTPREYAGVDSIALDEIAMEGVCTPYEKEYVRKDGGRVPVLVGAATFEDNRDDGFCFVLDLTDRKKLEQQFLRAQRMDSIGTLAGGIAHDLNNMLTPIIMSLQLFHLRFPDTESKDLIEMIHASAQRGADMVRQLLSFARGVEGRRVEVQVKHLVREIEQIANDTFLKHIQITTSMPPNLATVLGDPTQLHQLLLNLAVNARDAMPNGGTLVISAENVELDEQYAGLNIDARPGPYVLLSVRDSGTGIPQEVIEKIFDPFFTTKEVGKGTGLGLSTSLAIVKNHCGFIRVYSEPGIGTTFMVYLPANTGTVTAGEEQLVVEMPRGNGELILVLDDEGTVREITEQTLETYGYRAISAADAAQALSIFARQQEEIAVVLTDMMMPVMDGPATIQILQKMKPGVKIIAVSGMATSERGAQLAKLGVHYFLSKPYTAEMLLLALRDILREGD
jgi:PAS domain S-box-containing protein